MPKGFFSGKSHQQEPALHNTSASSRDTATCRSPAFHRPRTSSRQGQEKQGQEKQAPPAAPLDLKNAVPPTKTISPLTTASLDVDENLIGIALGSPRLVESQMYSHMRDDSTCSAAGNQRPGLGKSRWRKIGGLFKGRRAPTASQPFYQLRVSSDWPLQNSTYSIDLEDEKPRTGGSPPDEWPHFKQRKADHGPQDSRAKTKEKDDTSPLLQVDIPNVQMERYSVMFSGPLGKRARKNRIEDTPPELPDLPLPPRPAFSPRPKSPSFTLFPATHASKPSTALGLQNLPGPSPLTISQTALADQPWGRERESALWPSPLRIPESRRQPSDSSSTTIDLNVDGPPLQSSKPVSVPECTQASQPTPNPQPKPVPARPPVLRINTNVQSFRPATNKNTTNITIKPSPRSSSLTPNTIPKHSSPNTSHPKPEICSSPGTPLNTATPSKSNSKESSIPKIEISVARSVSVSRGTSKQSLIPIRRPECLDADERLIEQRAKTPTVMDGKYGHRHGNSQDARIESV